MPTLSNSIFALVLPSGQRAVYSVQPQHINDRPDTTLRDRVAAHGSLLAYEQGGQWFRPGGYEITDHRTIVLLERSPDA